MSITPVSNSLFQELQSFQNRAVNTTQPGSTQSAFADLQSPVSERASARPAFVVTINASQGQTADLTKHDFWLQREADIDQLGKALQSGDTASAQQAYQALVTLGQNGPLRNGTAFHRADRAADFAAIGQALQSGDLAGAQQAFSSLEDSFKPQTTALLGPPTPAPLPSAIPPQGTLPPGPPTPAPVPSAVPPQGTLPPGPPSPAPVPSAIPPQGSAPPGPPTLVAPPSTTGGGPAGPPDIIGNATGFDDHSSQNSSSLSLHA